MSDARNQILAGIRKSLGRGADDATRGNPLEARLAARGRGPIPARTAGLDRAGLVDRLEKQAREVACSVTRVRSLDEVPAELGRYLKSQNLPSQVEMAPDPTLDRVPWRNAPMLEIARGRPSGKEGVGVTSAFAAVAETGTLMIPSGETMPATMNFLPDTHVVVMPAARVVGPLEDAWARLRVALGIPDGAAVGAAAGRMPRTVNLITGPSRTGDIEQKIEMGAHGPRRLHLIVVEDDTLA
ncbi:MAG: lactate utilization protein [Alphaproteobacteria bacterium]|nr:lactate utilization protein [Alphaproteobacteria bacterium]